MLNILFTETSNNLRTFLRNVLPSIDADWWKKFVESGLSFQQRRGREEYFYNFLTIQK